MSKSDVRNIKRLAERLGARDSDVIRFAVKLMLAKLSPLQDPTVGGRSLVPVFVEWGSELMRNFDLDAATLASIINEGVAEDRRVDADDIRMIAMSGIQRSFSSARSAVGPRTSKGAGGRAAPRRENSGEAPVRSADNGEDSDDRELRRYLLDKYVGFWSAGRNTETGEEL